jgi:glycosyltransferase involved in cell wall biosynthesis
MNVLRGEPPRPLLVLTSTFPRWAGDHEPSFVLHLCRRLSSVFDVHVLAPHTRGALPREDLEGIHVYRFQYLPERWETLAYEGGILSRLRQRPLRIVLAPFFLLGAALAARRLLRLHSFSAVHAHWLIPQGVVALLAGAGRSGVPVLCTSHGGDLFALRRWPLPALKRWVLRRCRAVTVVSRAMAEEVRRLAPRVGRLEVIPMGTDLRGAFRPPDEPARRPDLVLFVGRLVEKKGVRHLIEAFPDVVARHPQAQLWIAGAGTDERALRAQAGRLCPRGAVQFLGPVRHADLPGLYRQAAVTVVPSVVSRGGDQEGFGLVIVEALGCGCPVIASDLPAIRDIIAPETTGILVAPGDAASLAGQISRLLGDASLRETLGQAGRERVLRDFDWLAVGDGYRRILLDLARRGE